MEIMKDKDALIHIQNKNHQRLLEELDSLVVSRRENGGRCYDGRL